MNDFSKFVDEDRRLVVLRVLLESEGYAANEYILQSMLERFGFTVSGDRVRTDLAWLKEQSLVAVDVVADVHIGRLQGRGEDVARGRIAVPGVKRPRAGQ